LRVADLGRAGAGPLVKGASRCVLVVFRTFK